MGGAQEELKGSLLFTRKLREALSSVQRKAGAGLGQGRDIKVQGMAGPRLALSSLDLEGQFLPPSLPHNICTKSHI